MKRIVVAFVAVAMGFAMFGISNSGSTANAAKSMKEGYGDGHCRACGLSNGHYRCAAFNAKYNHPSECTCGHSKSSHAYR